MALTALGINHISAPMAVRERVAFSPKHLPSVLREMRQHVPINEAVLLSTCNRTEIYTDLQSNTQIYQWLQQHCGNSIDIRSHCYAYEGIECVRHVLRVASGLDSMVLGEPQILGQMKQAYQLACDAGHIGSQFHSLFPMAFSVAKQIRTQTMVGRQSVTMAYAIMQLAKKIFSHVSHCRVLLVGAGDMMDLVATHVVGQGVQQVVIANRSLEKATQIAAPLGAQAIQIADIPQHIHQADIVVSATASSLPLIGKGMLESTQKRRKYRPMLVVDLAMPRDVESEASNVDGVYLFNLDDLHQVIQANYKSREQAAEQAEAIVEIQAQDYMRKLRVIDASQVITQFRARAEHFRDKQLQSALLDLANGKDPAHVVTSLARTITQKMIHKPTLKLREAASESRMDLMLLTQELFDIE